jgi:glucoamylase
MGRSVMLSNGHLMVGLNESGLVHDFYFPYVGLDNLTTSRSAHHYIGIWVNGSFSWLDDDSWEIKTDLDENALVGKIYAKNESLKLELHFQDFVDERYNAFCRRISISNLAQEKREVRLFMHQVFEISRAGRGDTALFVPDGNYILDYKGRVSLLIYAEDDNKKPFDQFAVGNYGIEDKEGTFRDAEDGELSGNLVEHAGVDSVIRCSMFLEPKSSTNVNYWIIAADSQFHAEIIHHVLKQKGLESRLEQTAKSWQQWLGIAHSGLSKIDAKYQPMAKKSLLVIKSHIDKHGGIIASCDSSIYNYGRDYYSYVWPRDGALTILPLIELGYTEEPKKFIEFCADTIHPAGYMMHKYQPDRSIGSTWHPLLHGRHAELAIQEDETASIVYAVGAYLKKTGDIDFVKSIYSTLVKPAANFMTRFIDKSTNLPHASYDLWEEKFATHTYTVVLTVAGLREAAEIADRFGEQAETHAWREAAMNIEKNLETLFSPEGQYFRKSLLLNEDGGLEFDNTLDSSSGYALAFFGSGAYPSELNATYKAIEEKLFNSAPSGGVPRYEHDNYFLSDASHLGNSWIICTLWLAQYYMKNGRRDEAQKLIDWTIEKASPSGMLPEQVDTNTGAPVGVSPLVWSHASLVETLVLFYK